MRTNKAFWENETKTKANGFGFEKTKRTIFIFKIFELVNNFWIYINFSFFFLRTMINFTVIAFKVVVFTN